MKNRVLFAGILFGFLLTAALPAFPAGQKFPAVLSIRDRAALVYQITQKRLDQLLPGMMRETGFDMWIISCNEDNPDPIFETMMPYENWNPITQILVFFDQGPEKGIERLNVSRTDTQGLFKNVWDAAAWDTQKKESQWDCLGRIVRERDPKRIGINEGEVQWAAGGLTVVLKNRLVEAVGPTYASRLQSAEPLATWWSETLLDEEIDLMEDERHHARAGMGGRKRIPPAARTRRRFYGKQRLFSGRPPDQISSGQIKITAALTMVYFFEIIRTQSHPVRR
jgi:hypothetical protein